MSREGLLLAVFLTTAPVLAQEEAQQPLESGAPITGVVGPDDVRSFTVTVPDDCVSLRIELSSPDTELELWGIPPGYEELYGEEWEQGYSPYIEPMTDMSPWVMVVDRYSSPQIESGDYTFEVSAPLGVGDSTEGVANFEIGCQLFRHAEPTPLPEGEILEGALSQESGCFHGYRIEVPKLAKSLRVDLFGSDDDLVILARRARPPTRIKAFVAEVNNSRGRKVLRLNSSSRPKLRPGAWFLDIIDPANANRTAPYKLHASFDDQPPAELLIIPALPSRLAPGQLGASLAAVVEISSAVGSGSGTFIDEDGRILTNAHVVSLPNGEPSLGPVSVACTIDPHRPPIELFNARVVEFDMDRDFAILQLVEGYYHQSLPLDLRLPFAPMAPPESAQLTDPLWVVGYPWTGGFGGRVSLSVTTGVVTGFDWIEAGTVIKTDAEIAGGNSGGAAFDASGRFVGVPTATIGSESDKIGYLHPVKLIPASWLER